jgi:gliding motility-associated-like protein
MKYVIKIYILVLFINSQYAQDFLNNDLNGIATGGLALPTNWQNVPFNDLNCLASSFSTATTDLTDIFGPGASSRIVGNPYSGNTFVSGLFGGSSIDDFWHEGIMQTVYGFNINSCYSVNFHQAVVKQSLTDFLDSSGSWAVYIDDNLIGISSPTISNEPFASTSFIWEFRSFNFKATATSHTIKFLPADDDSDQSTLNSLGGLRMGIDSIFINSSNTLVDVNLGLDLDICQGNLLTLDAIIPNGSYLWQDSSTNQTLNVSQTGNYWVQLTDNCMGTGTDTIFVNISPPPVINLGKDTSLCEDETLILDATTQNASYLWQDNSINSTLNVYQIGNYWVQVTVDNCKTTKFININQENCEIDLQIPNIFTPNNDGINDIFTPLISKGIVSMKTYIYNRWGKKIFESNNLEIDWNDNNVSDGVYFWIIYYKDINNVENKLNGYISVLK